MLVSNPQSYPNSPEQCPPKDFWVLVGIDHVIARPSIMIKIGQKATLRDQQCPPYDCLDWWALPM
ncbi:hypothetical protein [Moorena sp. SIO3H5]|uniref:hypothetical protein n=1 Tax=Moorena sp. SIO3H5 TaxID=2607834 RepID=UPI0013BDCFF6|nr:hypothetical protein [Moorena sp. SIO3H5]NEO69746.1 hypothetical protein [Moorena sp. SIO3H5]